MRADPDQPHHEDCLDTSAAMRMSVFEETGSRHSSSSSPTHEYSRKSPLTVRTRTTTPLSSCSNSNSPPPPPPSSSHSSSTNNNTPLPTASLNAPPQSYYSTVRVKSDLQAQLAKAQQQQQQQQPGKKFKSEEAAVQSLQQPSEVSQSLSTAGGGGGGGSGYQQNHQAQTAFYSSLLHQLRHQADPVKDSHPPTLHSLKVISAVLALSGLIWKFLALWGSDWKVLNLSGLSWKVLTFVGL